jgi:hypothetical protein
MRIKLTDGEMLELSDRDARTLYETLLERARTRGGDLCGTQASSCSRLV